VKGVLTWLSTSGVVQGVIIGATFAFLTTVLILNAVGKRETRTVNGWSAVRRAGLPGNGILVRAALQKALPLVNVFDEAAYWTSTRDESGSPLTGGGAYRLHFPDGQLPPNHAFWSLTVTDTVGYMVDRPTARASVDSHSGLVENADGSVDIHLQPQQPLDATPNWLPTPRGRFKLTLRAYLPGPAIVEGDYDVPPVVRVRS
jgi:hypothetical protein